MRFLVYLGVFAFGFAGYPLVRAQPTTFPGREFSISIEDVSVRQSKDSLNMTVAVRFDRLRGTGPLNLFRGGFVAKAECTEADGGEINGLYQTLGTLSDGFLFGKDKVHRCNLTIIVPRNAESVSIRIDSLGVKTHPFKVPTPAGSPTK